MTTRREFVKASAAMAAGLALPNGFAFAQALPDVARIIVGFPPGGSTDIFARRVADKLRGTLAANVLVENRPGGGGQTGVLAVKDAPPDGSVLLYTPASMITIYPHTYAKLAYKADEVSPVTTGAFVVHAFAVGPAVPESVRSLKDFLAWAKANPSRASVGNPGAGSMPHLLAGTLGKQTGTDLNAIPFLGSGPGIQQLLGGQIAAMSSPIGDHMPHLASGKLRLLATSGTARSGFARDVPTYVEQGYPNLVSREWFGFFVPGKTPQAIRERVHRALVAALAQPDVIESVKPVGLEVEPRSLREFEELVKSDSESAAQLIRTLGFKADS
jgi:tripartite-type tricarboxylate transporter receptor subunit TctC